MAVFLSSLLALGFLTTSVSAAEEVRLSSLELGRVQQGTDKPGVDRSADGKPLSIGGHPFAHGFGTHAPSALHLDLHGGTTRFTAQVGINDEGQPIRNNGSVEFIIEGDGKVLWSSPVMRGGMAAQAVDLDLSGVQMLALRVTDGFD
ncbi:MAG: NPCBM/NEW2 domain-containing protein, partial [Verrucomicrobiales bacterium]